MSDKKSSVNIEELIAKLPFDPTKEGQGDQSVLQEAYEVLRKERNEELKEKAVKLLRDLVDLLKEKAKIKKDFLKKDQQLDKTLGKLAKQIENYRSGSQSIVEESETEDEEENATKE